MTIIDTQPNSISVIGAGVMGVGVSQNLATVGFNVKLYDLSLDKLNKAIRIIRNNFKSLKMTNKIQYSTDEIINRIQCYDCFDTISESDYLIENITENWEIKQKLYSEIDKLCSPECVIAANTSAIPIHRFARLINNSEKVIGIHFMNPVPSKKLVELIPSKYTSQKTVLQTQQLLRRMDKDWVLVKDGAGFVSNRILMLTVNEAVLTLEQGRASVADIDKIFRGCFSHKMGPLETADLIGLDTIRDTLLVLFNEYQDPKYTPAKLLEEYVANGMLGRKSNKGFYDYDFNTK